MKPAYECQRLDRSGAALSDIRNTDPRQVEARVVAGEVIIIVDRSTSLKRPLNGRRQTGRPFHAGNPSLSPHRNHMGRPVANEAAPDRRDRQRVDLEYIYAGSAVSDHCWARLFHIRVSLPLSIDGPPNVF